MTDDKINPIGLLYEDFAEIVNNITIKYFIKAEKYETLESQQNANEYLDVINGKDNFFTYVDYTYHDYINTGWDDIETIKNVIKTGNVSLVPKQYREKLLSVRRQRVLDNFEEQNNYYRMLNGYPDLEDTDYYYASSLLVKRYGLPADVPIHMIQDVYNKKEDGQGDYYISIAEGTGYLETLKEAHPEKEYLKYVGSKRISIKTARDALNFQCIQLNKGNIDQSLYDEFLLKYDQCREYFVKVIYMKEYRTFLDYYDDFIAMCIMVMTVQQINIGQLKSEVNREFFNIYGVRALYQAYNIPFDMDIDEYTQNQLVQNLNLLIQNKATNKIIYNLAYLLGFSNIKIYKYYLGKERKFDLYGAPIVAYKEKFNSDTGEVETVYDYEEMYDLYFQKDELRNTDFSHSFLDKTNTVKYSEVTDNDPFWWTDDKLYNRVWETDYNFVESKYLGLGVSYSMTNMIFENVLLLKMIMQENKMTQSIFIELPKITKDDSSISLFDLIIYLICLLASKHNLTGEIITIPTQVISVIDYMRNVEETDMLVDTLNFNFEYFDPSNIEARQDMHDLKFELGEEEYNKFMVWVNDIAYNSAATKEERIKKLNLFYTDAKNLYRFLNYHMTVTHSRRTYNLLKNMSNAIFYSREMREIFTITGEYSEQERTAWTYYEYLYHINPMLYSSFFEIDLDSLWHEYCDEHELSPEEFTYEDYMIQIELGEIKVDYGQVRSDYSTTKDEILYFYINHALDRLSHVVSKLDMVYLINESSSTLSDLLWKLIKFFKSYTVDLISFDILYILDFKPGNTIKLLDEFENIIKKMQLEDIVKLSHGDLLNHVESNMTIFDRLSIEDKMFYYSIISLDDKDLVKMYDKLMSITSHAQIDDAALKYLFDTFSIESESALQDKSLKFKDAVKVYVEEVS